MDKKGFLKRFVEDTLGDKKLTWQQYADIYSPEGGGEYLRSIWRGLKNTHMKKGLWHPGEPIEDDWRERVSQAVFKRDSNTNSVDLSRFYVNKVWEQQTKDGEVIQLRSFEANRDVNALNDAVNDALDRFKEIAINYTPNPIILPKPAGNDFGMRILTADKHYGSYTRNDLFGHNYNMDIASSRVKEWLSVVDQEYRRFGTFKILDIVDLGDSADGYQGFTTSRTHKMPQEGTDHEHYDRWIKDHIDFVDAVIRGGYAENIRFIFATNSNHGGAWEYVWTRSLQIYLNAKYPQVEVLVSKDFIFHTINGKHIHIYTHGKPSSEFGMKHGFPAKVDPKTEDFIEAYVKYKGLNKHLQYDEEKIFISLYKGDLHISNEEYAKTFRYKNIMSFIGNTDYTQYNYSRGWGYCGFETEIYNLNSPYSLQGKHFYKRQ